MMSIFTITEDNMTDLIGYVGQVFSDLSPIILLVIGVGLGLLVIGVIIRSFSH